MRLDVQYCQLNFFSELGVTFKGSDAVERNGIFFSVTNDDHPVAALSSRPYRVLPGNVATVALSIREVNFKLIDEVKQILSIFSFR